MDIKVIIIFSFSIIYGLFEFIMSRRGKKNIEISKSGDKGSIRILVVAIFAGYWLSFMLASSKTGRIYHFNLFFITGAVVALTGFIIRIKAILLLRQQFTYTVTKVENHSLTDTGLYKVIRHPGYSGQLLIFLGISISLSNWISILAMMVPVLTAYSIRINIEEKFMTQQLGQVYTEYKSRTKKLIPKIF
ncbi:MAG TPA: isoprenylcysteine carboxylmethyltransferase family protein [Bacteroidales bacterium]|nr:isoprenylcysteine carboxylmethyltransferase family protein [Bacteroidales bacterium]